MQREKFCYLIYGRVSVKMLNPKILKFRTCVLHLNDSREPWETLSGSLSENVKTEVIDSINSTLVSLKKNTHSLDDRFLDECPYSPCVLGARSLSMLGARVGGGGILGCSARPTATILDGETGEM
jgi:hypothetical protein